MSEKFCPSCDGDGVIRDELCGLCNGHGTVNEEVHDRAKKYTTRRDMLKENGMDRRKGTYYMED